MSFVYHRIPKNMKGNVLYPLNILKKKHPEIYKKIVKKYDWRPKVKANKIPYLNCLWNDVLHFTPIHPRKIRKELEKAGLKTKKQKWYKINAKTLESKKKQLFICTNSKKRNQNSWTKTISQNLIQKKFQNTKIFQQIQKNITENK